MVHDVISPILLVPSTVSSAALGAALPPSNPAPVRDVGDVVADAELLLKHGPDAGLSAAHVRALLHRLLLESSSAHPQMGELAQMVLGREAQHAANAARGSAAVVPAPSPAAAAGPSDLRLARLEQTLATLGGFCVFVFLCLCFVSSRHSFWLIIVLFPTRVCATSTRPRAAATAAATAAAAVVAAAAAAAAGRSGAPAQRYAARGTRCASFIHAAACGRHGYRI